MTELNKDDVISFALAGNAIITIQSGITEKHFTYKIKKHKGRDNLYFIYLLNGVDNNNDYSYIGCYYSDTEYFHPTTLWKNRPIHSWPKSLRAINFFFEKIHNIPSNLYIYHEGRCGRCGRRLTTPESIKRGLGPECIRYFN